MNVDQSQGARSGAQSDDFKADIEELVDRIGEISKSNLLPVELVR